MTIIINVRHYSRSYIAHGGGFKPTASSQVNAVTAARRLADRLADGRKYKLKCVTGLTYLCEISDDCAGVPPAVVSDPSSYRIGKREGQHAWQIKIAPGWSVIKECVTLREAATWLTARGVDINQIEIVSVWPRVSLGQYLRDMDTPA
jgi:hypothetical protein